MKRRRPVAVELTRLGPSRTSVCILCAYFLLASSFQLPVSNPRQRSFKTSVGMSPVAFLSSPPAVTIPSWAFLPSSPATAAWFSQDPQENTLFHPSFVEVVLATLAGGLLLTIAQASFAVTNYRSNFGDAPLPMIPSHGVVVATNENPQDVLRLLLVGDSLAVGVGQSVTCTPVLPEVISRIISRETGKAVFWTCHGESGASTRRILQELERDRETLNERVHCDTDDGKQFKAEGSLITNKDALSVWRKRLNEYQRRFRPDSLGPFDVVIVVTGTNDLKIMLFPFLIVEDDRELRRQSNKQGGFIDDLQQLMLTLNERMERGILRTIEESAEAAAETLRVRVLKNLEHLETLFKVETNSTGTGLWQEAVRANIEELERLFNDDKVDTNVSLEQLGASHLTVTKERPTENVRESEVASDSISPHPLYVLPGMPARALPSLRNYPLRWLAVPVLDSLAKKTRQLAEANPDILFVKDPALEDIIDYQAQQGAIWEQRSQEQILLSLRNIRNEDCNEIEEAMKEYYEQKIKSYDTMHDRTPLFERPDAPGTKLFCIDRIHPNEAGYDFWGRHIANAIITEWKRKEIDY